MNQEINKMLTDENIINFNKKYNLYPEFIIQNLLCFKKKNNYVSVKSNQQIKRILIESNKNEDLHYAYLNLLSLIIRHVKFQNVKDIIYLLDERKSDIEIYNKMKKLNYIKRKMPKINTMCHTRYLHFKKKIDLFSFNVKKVLGDSKIEKYLDFGCGDCKLTRTYGKSIDIKDGNIYGADITEWGGYSDKSRNEIGINFIGIEKNKNFKLDDKMFDLVSCFMVLHHVDNLDFTLKELNRITKLNGYMYLTEHSVINNLEKMLCDVEHSIFGIVHRNLKDYTKNYYAEYRHWIEWDIILFKYGFQYQSGRRIYSLSDSDLIMTKKAWSIYKKIRDV